MGGGLRQARSCLAAMGMLSAAPAVKGCICCPNNPHRLWSLPGLTFSPFDVKMGKPTSTEQVMSSHEDKDKPTRDIDDAQAIPDLMRENRLTASEMDNFDRAFGLIAFTLNRYIVDHLLRFARQFGPDYQMLVVWGVVAHQCVIHLLPANSRPRGLLNQQGLLADPAPELRAVRQRDLSQITGIPKETVRRKLIKLEQHGWIRRQGAGWVLDRENLDPELREFSRESAKRLLAVSDHIRTLLREAGTSAD